MNSLVRLLFFCGFVFCPVLWLLLTQHQGFATRLTPLLFLFLPAAMDFPQHSKQVLEQLNQQRQLGLLCDCTFVVDGIDFKAHKAVLAACSEYFRMLFVDQKDVVHLDISNAAGRQRVVPYPSLLLKRSDLLPQGSSACNLVHFWAF